MPAQQKSADQSALASGFAPFKTLGLGKTSGTAEPLIWPCVSRHTQTRNHYRSKGPSKCQSEKFFSPLPHVQALQHVATQSANRPLVAARSARVPRLSQAVAFCRVPQSVRAQTFLPASRVPYAAANVKPASAFRAQVMSNQIKCPAQLALMRGFSVPSRPKRTAHVQ